MTGASTFSRRRQEALIIVKHRSLIRVIADASGEREFLGKESLIEGRTCPYKKYQC